MSLSFNERLQRLVDYTYQENYNARIQRLITSFKLRFPQADMHGIYYQGQQKKLLSRYSCIPFFIIDEWLVSDISDAEIYFLLELIERCSDTASTIFCTRYRKDDLVKPLSEGTQAEEIVDRYLHTTFWIETESMNMCEYC